MSDPIRAALEQLVELDEHGGWGWDEWGPVWAAARAALDNSDESAVPLKERPDFIAGYREGLADGRRIVAHEDADRAAQIAGLRAVLACWEQSLAMNSDQLPIPLFSEQELAQLWNQQADEFNQVEDWDSLDSSEQLAWAQARALQLTRPAPPASEEVEELVEWLHGQDGGIERRAIYSRIAALLEQQQERISELDNEVETQRMKVVCCGMVAVSDTPFSAAKNRACHPDYWSEAAEDVARQIDELMRLREVLKPVPVSEGLPQPKDCLDEGWAWFFNSRVGWRQMVMPVSAAYTHWLPAHALPIPQEES